MSSDNRLFFVQFRHSRQKICACIIQLAFCFCCANMKYFIGVDSSFSNISTHLGCNTRSKKSLVKTSKRTFLFIFSSFFYLFVDEMFFCVASYDEKKDRIFWWYMFVIFICFACTINWAMCTVQPFYDTIEIKNNLTFLLLTQTPFAAVL